MSEGRKTIPWDQEPSNRKNTLHLRAGIIQAVRKFFIDNQYLEVETPLLIPAPAPETHIDAMRAGDLFLQTSPELCMKRMLAAGHSRIFQICKAFRRGERGRHHLPEMTLLEWYRAGSDYFDLMDECEEMILSVIADLGLKEKIVFQGQALDLSRPWNRMTVQEAFERFALTSMEEAVDSGRFDELLVERVEPGLDPVKPTFLYDYPATLAALSRLKEAHPEVAERFELYMGGLEIANAFSELTDPLEQEKRFKKEIKRRQLLGKDVYPMPRKFLQALSYMPTSAGIALGLDRLVMVLTGRGRIDDVVTFTPEEL